MRRTRRGTTTLLAASLFASLLTWSAPGQSHADPIADKRAEAARLEAELEAQGTKLSIVAERYNEIRLRAEETTAALLDAERKQDAARQEVARVQEIFDAQIVSIYKGTRVPEVIAQLTLGNLREMGAHKKYSEAIATHANDVIEDLQEERRKLAAEQDRLQTAQEAVREAEDRVAEERVIVEAAMRGQQALLAQVEGDLATLVAEEQARRQAEEERRTREELARRRRNPSPSPSQGPLPNAPAPNQRAGIAVDTAKAQLGKPYLWAADGPESFDCSGLTMYAWAKAGVSLPHSSRAQYASLPHVSIDNLAPGDLVFYGNPIHHVGMFIGEGQMVNAPQTGQNVRINSIYRSDFTGASRPG